MECHISDEDWDWGGSCMAACRERGGQQRRTKRDLLHAAVASWMAGRTRTDNQR